MSAPHTLQPTLLYEDAISLAVTDYTYTLRLLRSEMARVSRNTHASERDKFEVLKLRGVLESQLLSIERMILAAFRDLASETMRVTEALT